MAGNSTHTDSREADFYLSKEVFSTNLNLSGNMSTDSETGVGLTDVQHLTVGVYLITVGVLSFCGNILVLLIVWKFKSLRTTTNIFIINLAMADLGISLFGFPFSASSNFAERWVSGDTACRWYAFNGMLFGIASIGFLTAISIDRYIITCRYRLFLDLKAIYYVLASLVTWLNAAFWAAAPLLGWGCYGVDPSGAACGLIWDCDWLRHATYTVSIFIICFCIPGLIIVYCYIRTYRFLTYIGSDCRHESLEWIHQQEFTRMCAVAILLFVIAWTPYAVVFLWATFGDPADIPSFIQASPALFAKSSAFYNPILYALMNRRFRIAMKQMFKCGTKVSEEEQMELNCINGRL